MKVSIIITIVISMLLVIALLQNNQPVDLTFLFWTGHISRTLLMLITFIVGVTVGLILGRRRKKNVVPAPAAPPNQE